MRHMRSRRILAMFLALSMIFGLLTTSALAAETGDGQNASVTENTAENQTVGETQKGEGTTGDSETPPTETSKQEDSKEEEKESAQADPQSNEYPVAPIAETDVATVGEQSYATLKEAFNALSSDNYTLTLAEGTDAWNDATPVYWKVGEGEYTAAVSLAAAVKAAYMANEAGSEITIVCKPGADVGKMTHGHVADSITIYGNNAFISDGECDLEVEEYAFSRETGAVDKNSTTYLEKDITITAYEMDNLSVWGTRRTDNTVTIKLNDCDSTDGNTAHRVYINGAVGENIITLNNCDFSNVSCPVYSNADGSVTVNSCKFTNCEIPVNINHKANGEQSVAVNGCTFTECGAATGDAAKYAAPVRFVNSGSGTQSATVSSCTFPGTVGTNGDILLGDGREGKPSKDVSLSVFGTAANVVAQKPGYYTGTGTNNLLKGEQTLTASDSLENASIDSVISSGTTTETLVKTSEELKQAIDNAKDGDTIYLDKGTFTTYGNTSPNKSLTFAGQG